MLKCQHTYSLVQKQFWSSQTDFWVEPMWIIVLSVNLRGLIYSSISMLIISRLNRTFAPILVEIIKLALTLVKLVELAVAFVLLLVWVGSSTTQPVDQQGLQDSSEENITVLQICCNSEDLKNYKLFLDFLLFFFLFF